MDREEILERLNALEERVFALEHPYYCRVCGENFSSGDALRQHLTAAFRHKEPNQCT